MADKLSMRQQRAIESAQGYLLLELPDAALRELSSFESLLGSSDDAVPLAVSQLRGEALRSKQQYEEALQNFQKVIPHAEQSAELHMSMAWCFKRIGRLDKAIASMRAAYASSPNEPIVLYNLACYFSLAGDLHESLSWLDRAFRLDDSLRQLVPKETDFDPIRDEPEFQQLMQAAKS